MSKGHRTKSIKNSVHKLLFCHVQILETQCSDTIISTYANTVSILFNYTILLNRESEKASIQVNFLKLNPLFTLPLLWQVPTYGLLPLETKKLHRFIYY